jgi:SsrA-binding protein
MKDVCVNRKARFDYEILENYEAGIVLTGSEVKSLRERNANLRDSFCIIKNGEVFLVNMHISHYTPATIFNHEPTRTRKLLLKKDEIKRLIGKTKERGLVLIPLRVYFKNRYAKVEIALAKGRKKYEKRELIKERDIQRELRRDFKL